jgi:hypothetical protein
MLRLTNRLKMTRSIKKVNQPPRLRRTRTPLKREVSWIPTNLRTKKIPLLMQDNHHLWLSWRRKMPIQVGAQLHHWFHRTRRTLRRPRTPIRMKVKTQPIKRTGMPLRHQTSSQRKRIPFQVLYQLPRSRKKRMLLRMFYQRLRSNR